MTVPVITPEIVRAALADASACMKRAPRGVTPERVEAARTAWAWLGLLENEHQHNVVRAVAAGLDMPTIAKALRLPPWRVERMHREALETIAGRLNRALAP
jgi:hypothetical protein